MPSLWFQGFCGSLSFCVLRTGLWSYKTGNANWRSYSKLYGHKLCARNMFCLRQVFFSTGHAFLVYVVFLRGDGGFHPPIGKNGKRLASLRSVHADSEFDSILFFKFVRPPSLKNHCVMFVLGRFFASCQVHYLCVVLLQGWKTSQPIVHHFFLRVCSKTIHLVPCRPATTRMYWPWIARTWGHCGSNIACFVRRWRYACLSAWEGSRSQNIRCLGVVNTPGFQTAHA